MSGDARALRAPRRRVTYRVTRQVLQAVLVLAISISAIVVLATLHEPVSVDHPMTATGASEIDARWTPKWRAAAETATAGQATIVDTRWTAKAAPVEALKSGKRP